MSDNKTTDPCAEYRGPQADAKAAQIESALGTDAEMLTDTVWLLRYTTVKNNIQWPTHEELMRERYGDEPHAG
jgi:hypothetical protein